MQDAKEVFIGWRKNGLNGIFVVRKAPSNIYGHIMIPGSHVHFPVFETEMVNL